MGLPELLVQGLCLHDAAMGSFIICTFPLLEQTSGSDAIAGLRLVASLLRYVLNIVTRRIGLVGLGHL